MTSTKLVSVKLPIEVLNAIPAAHEGRSGFIIAALKEKNFPSDRAGMEADDGARAEAASDFGSGRGGTGVNLWMTKGWPGNWQRAARRNSVVTYLDSGVFARGLETWQEP